MRTRTYVMMWTRFAHAAASRVPGGGERKRRLVGGLTKFSPLSLRLAVLINIVS
jgi:hypothetical protein